MTKREDEAVNNLVEDVEEDGLEEIASSLSPPNEELDSMVNDLAKDVGKDGLEEIASPGTPTRTDGWLLKRETAKSKLGEEMEFIMAQIREENEEVARLAALLKEKQNLWWAIEKDIGSTVSGKRRDVLERKSKKEQGVEVG